MKTPKVLVVATSRKTRGGITSVVKAHEQGEQWGKYKCYWIETHRDGNKLGKIAYFCSGLIKFLVRIPLYDIVHIHFSNNNSLKRKIIFTKIAKFLNKKIILHFHAYDPNTTLGGKHSKDYKQIMQMANYIIVLSHWWKDQLITYFPEYKNKITIIFNPCIEVDLSTNSKKENSILYAGTVNQRKGYADLLKAFALIAKKHPYWHVVIAGNGELETAKELSLSLGISDQVKILGWIQGSDKDRIFRESSIFCLPSYAEGFPMAVLDAWAYGLPVITTPVGGIPDVAKDWENMVLFSPGDIENLSKALDRLIEDKELREKISCESKNLANSTFNKHTINSQIDSLYRKIISC